MRPEDVFRDANDAIADKARGSDWEATIPFLCECSDRRCFGRVDLTLAEYEKVRSHPQRYLVLAGHEVPDALLMARDDRFAVVEKLRDSVS
jgi:hypothetical protein